MLSDGCATIGIAIVAYEVRLQNTRQILSIATQFQCTLPTHRLTMLGTTTLEL